MTLGPDLWYEALASPLGIVVKTDDPAGDARELYIFRKKLKDPDLETISIMTSPTSPDSELWLVKRQRAVSDA